MPLEIPNEKSLTDMVAGIVADFQKLLSQQMALLRAEIRSDWSRTKSALIPIAIGAGLAVVGCILVGFCVAHLIYWAMMPPGMDPGRIPLWGCFGIAALAFLAIGGGLALAGIKTLKSFNPLPDQSADALKTNLKSIVEGGTPATR